MPLLRRTLKSLEFILVYQLVSCIVLRDSFAVILPFLTFLPLSLTS